MKLSIVCLSLFLIPMKFLSSETRIDLPIPMRLDRSFHLSSWYINLKVTGEEKRPVKELVDSGTDKEVFRAFDIIKKGESSEYKNVLQLSSSSSDIIYNYQDAFSGLYEDLNLYQKILCDDGYLIIWGHDKLNERSPLRRNLRFVNKDEGNIECDLINRDYLSKMITQSFQISAQDETENSQTKPFNQTYKIGSGDNSINLNFLGTEYDFKIFDIQDEIPPALKFFQNTYLLLQEGKKYDHASTYTAESKEKMIDWIEKNLSDFALYKEAMTSEDRRIRYLIDADPFYLVFYTLDSLEESSPIKYEYVYKDDSGKFHLTNFYYKGYLDKFIFSDFEKGFLRHIIFN